MPESQYAGYSDLPRERLGLRANVWWRDDPRSLLFSMARYEFVAKMLAGYGEVLEIGCGDAWGTRLVQQEVGHVTGIDFDPVFIQDAIKRNIGNDNRAMDFFVHDMLRGYVNTWEGGLFNAAYAIDVLEHIAPENEHTFIKNVVDSLQPDSVFIIGTPSKESQAYASAGSKAGHVNTKTGAELRAMLGVYFQHVFPFSMNDTAIYPGFSPMARYYFAVCAGKC